MEMPLSRVGRPWGPRGGLQGPGSGNQDRKEEPDGDRDRQGRSPNQTEARPPGQDFEAPTLICCGRTGPCRFSADRHQFVERSGVENGGKQNSHKAKPPLGPRWALRCSARTWSAVKTALGPKPSLELVLVCASWGPVSPDGRVVK